jgi:hypothetical protein
MSGAQTSHITVTYREDGDEITRIYAVTEDVSRKLDRKRDWLGRHIKNWPGKKLQEWLEDNGARLDSSAGPAVVVRVANGATTEEYYHDGKLHREDGPAYARRDADGTPHKEYWRNGRFVEPSARSPCPDVTVQRPASKTPNVTGAPDPA